MTPLLLLAGLLPPATGLLWFPDAPNNLGDLDGLVDANGTFYMRYNNGACDLGGAVDSRCAAGPGGHCDSGSKFSRIYEKTTVSLDCSTFAVTFESSGAPALKSDDVTTYEVTAARSGGPFFSDGNASSRASSR
jgi:hypothetical protein